MRWMEKQTQKQSTDRALKASWLATGVHSSAPGGEASNRAARRAACPRKAGGRRRSGMRAAPWQEALEIPRAGLGALCLYWLSLRDVALGGCRDDCAMVFKRSGQSGIPTSPERALDGLIACVVPGLVGKQHSGVGTGLHAKPRRTCDSQWQRPCVS